MKEIELKFRVKNFKKIKEELKKIGGKLAWKGIEENYYFDTPDSKLKKNKEVMRVKKWEGYKTTLTVKADLKDNKKRRFSVREERQILIDDIDLAIRILKLSGFVEVFRYSKYREHWKLGGAVVELDKIGKKCFVEIEASKNKIRELAKKLRLSFKNSTNQSYLDMLKY